jgi:hypothetical protein
MGGQLDKELIDDVLTLAREIAPEIEATVSGIRDPELRAALAGAIMQHLLTEARAFRSRATTNVTGRGVNAGVSSDQTNTAGTQGRILHLRSEGFFGEPRRLEQVLEELRIGGYHHSKSDVRMSLLRLARKKLLRRIPFGAGRQKTFLYADP